MPNTKVIDVVSAIHKRVREQAASYQTPAVMEDWSNDLGKLHAAYNTAYCARNLVGSVPQLPNTLLGVAAGWVIGIAQRMLFWYTPQIRYFNEAATTVFNRVCSLEERKFQVFLALADRLENLERETGLLRAAQAAERVTTRPADPAPPGQTAAAPEPAQKGVYTRSPIDTKDFYFQLQGRFQSDVQADASRLEMYRSVIGNLDPKAPAGAWLDIGCGRGKWLRLAQDGGYEATGVDSNPAAIQQCRESGFQVTEGDALEFLRSADDGSYAVISAFHVLEHCPFAYCLNLVYQIARTLKPGGVLLIETPHAGNLLMAAEQFWMDPTHNRPIPLPLMEFLFEYCGIGVIHRFEVNPRAESEHLPFRELELANRLDMLLYGPQDYAMMGRRDG
jgi:O-antigen chain-terminating methyltransferase